MPDPLQVYERALTPGRAAAIHERSLDMLMSPGCHLALFARWLLRYSAHSAPLTRRLESWSALSAIVAADAYAAAGWLRDRGHPHPDVTGLLAHRSLASARELIDLYRQADGHPAIHYETAQFWYAAGPALLLNCERAFGPDARSLGGLAVPAGRSGQLARIWRRELGNALVAEPARLPAMISTGRTTVRAYTAFIAECLQLADADLPSPLAPQPRALRAGEDGSGRR
jgi:hypothetical protein